MSARSRRRSPPAGARSRRSIEICADNRDADFWYTKRIEDQQWFALIGVVANAALDEDETKLPQNEVFLIGSGVDFSPKKSGYLYCFANDAWHAYHNNKGSVVLTVTRLL